MKKCNTLAYDNNMLYYSYDSYQKSDEDDPDILWEYNSRSYIHDLINKQKKYKCQEYVLIESCLLHSSTIRIVDTAHNYREILLDSYIFRSSSIDYQR